MSFKVISKKLHAERGSMSIKFSESAIIEYTPSLFDGLKKVINDIRESSWPDRGFSFNLVDTVRINDGGIKFITNTVDYVIKNNSINMDIWVNNKLSPIIKDLTANIQEKIDKSNDRSIRIRKAVETKTGKFIILNWWSGWLSVIIGSTELIRDQAIKTNWIEGLNMIQLVGGLMIGFSFLPFAFKHYKSYKERNK